MKKALVFSGGGAKGSYQIGVWKALNRLHKKFDIVTGTSIGSINGALYVMGKYKTAKKLWLTMTTKDLFHSQNIKGLASEIVKNHGMKFDKAEKVIKDNLKEKEIRKSKIDYGLVTVSYKTKKPKMLTKEQMPKGTLVDYIIASSTCFPAVEKKEINGEYYIDGGYYDNMPINLAIEMGAEEILAIDLSAFGLKKNIKNDKVKIDIIKDKNNELFTLEFNKQLTIKNMNIGYNDTMKYFGHLEGNKYTFKKGELNKNYNKIEKEYIKLINKNIVNNKKPKIAEKLLKISKYNKILLDINSNKKVDKYVADSIEYLGSTFELDNSKIYTLSRFNKKIINIIDNTKNITYEKNLKGKLLITYLYKNYFNKKLKEEFLGIALLFPKEYLAVLYLISTQK